MTSNKITFQFDDLQVSAHLDNSKAAKALCQTLPIKSKIERWGDEIYFEIPVKIDFESTTLDVKVGDVAYWPDGSCLCLFFGKTPVSTDDRPRPASPVVVIGQCQTSPSVLRKVRAGTTVILNAL